MTNSINKFNSIINAADQILKGGGIALIDSEDKIKAAMLLIGDRFAAGNLGDSEILKVALEHAVKINKNFPPDRDGGSDGGEIRKRMPYEAMPPRQTLPITLIPPSERGFKMALMDKKRAYMTIYYNDGRQRHKTWRANDFNWSSNVIGNLRSRAEFRQGAWQEAGIERVEVSIEDPKLRNNRISGVNRCL